MPLVLNVSQKQQDLLTEDAALATGTRYSIIVRVEAERKNLSLTRAKKGVRPMVEAMNVEKAVLEL